MKENIEEELERGCTFVRLSSFVCCDGDVDLFLNICGKVDGLWERTSLCYGWTVGDPERIEKGKETVCNSLSFCLYHRFTILQRG